MITDPRAIRAMSNPIRLAAVDELYRSQRPTTATELARLTGATPSAMSYYLRELARIGLVRRGDEADDGRERPWLAAARHYSLVVSDAGNAAERAVLIDSRLLPMRQRMEEVMVNRARLPEPERREAFMVLATGSLLLTDDELADLQERVAGVFLQFEERSAPRTEDASHRRARYMWSCLPEDVGEND